MNTPQAIVTEAIENFLPLPDTAKPGKRPQYREPFKIKPFVNPRTDSQSWRVDGFKRDGVRVRDNFTDLARAQSRQLELTAEWLQKETETIVRATKLTDSQLRIAETAFLKLEDDSDLLSAVAHWLKHGKPVQDKECPRVDDAVTEFLESLKGSESRRFHTKRHLKTRVNLFANSIGNCRLDAITPDTVEKLAGRGVSARTRINDRSAVSSFFKFCMARPRAWIRHNPARDAIVTRPEDKPIVVLSVAQSARLLEKATRFKKGKLLPYVVGGLIAGLRPFELQRINWNSVNLTDCEITIEPSMTKTKRKRTVLFNDGPPAQKPFNAALKSWLAICKGKPFFPPNADNDLQALKRLAGVPLVVDVLRHTAVSHFFRLTGSYGLAAELFGNSEQKIKAHYQGKVSSTDTAKFFSLRPKGDRK